MSGENTPYRAELDAAREAARAAGAVILDFVHEGAAATYDKVDGSPVTDADLGADRAIRAVLHGRFPDIPILSEEGEDAMARLDSRRVWIVDPLDGTEQFILGTGEFDVLIALVEDGRPVVAAGYQPTKKRLITATLGGGAWVNEDDEPPRRITFVPVSAPIRVGTTKWFGAPENAEIVRDVADRLGVVPEPVSATGFSPRLFLPPRALDAVIGVRVGEDQTMASEWDFAVGDLVIHEAGGAVTDLGRQRFQYNKPIPRTVGGLVAAVDPETHGRVLTAVQASVGLTSRPETNAGNA